MSNLEGHLHHGFFLYMMMGPDHFVSIGEFAFTLALFTLALLAVLVGVVSELRAPPSHRQPLKHLPLQEAYDATFVLITTSFFGSTLVASVASSILREGFHWLLSSSHLLRPIFSQGILQFALYECSFVIIFSQLSRGAHRFFTASLPSTTLVEKKQNTPTGSLRRMRWQTVKSFLVMYSLCLNAALGFLNFPLGFLAAALSLPALALASPRSPPGFVAWVVQGLFLGSFCAGSTGSACVTSPLFGSGLAPTRLQPAGVGLLGFPSGLSGGYLSAAFPAHACMLLILIGKRERN